MSSSGRKWCNNAKLVAAWRAGTAERNKNCLICLNSIRQEPQSLLCVTCPRVMHFACLSTKFGHSGHSMHCPLCIKRRWHLVLPVTPVQRDGQSADDYRMKRIRRYYRWHRYNCEPIQDWQKLCDDGSLESDRKLIIDMGAAKVKFKQQQTSIAGGAGGPESHDESLHGKIRAHAGQSQGGEAAGYYNPDASRLGTEKMSIGDRSLGEPPSVGDGRRGIAPLAAESGAASSQISSSRASPFDQQAAASVSTPDSRGASSGNSSSYAPSKLKRSVVRSRLRSLREEAQRVASSIASSSRSSAHSAPSVSASGCSTAPTSVSASSQWNRSKNSSGCTTTSSSVVQGQSRVSATHVSSRPPSLSRATLRQGSEGEVESASQSNKAAASKASHSRSTNRRLSAPAGWGVGKLGKSWGFAYLEINQGRT